MNTFFPQKLLLILCFYFLLSNQAFCIIDTASTGTWENPSSWSTGHVPNCGDTVIIQAGVTITVTQQENYTSCSSPLIIYDFGILVFGNGKKLMLPCGSYLGIRNGGLLMPQIHGGGNANLVEICHSSVWRASDGPLTGPFCLPPGAPGCSAILPITLASFTAEWGQQQTVILKWITESEVNNDHFEIERALQNSSEELEWKNIGIVNGTGNSTTPHYYSLVDDSPLSYSSEDFTGQDKETIYYRLKQVDYDGNQSLFDPISLRLMAPTKQFLLSPNPIHKNHSLNILMQGENSSTAVSTIVVMDALGRLVFSRIIELQPGVNSLDVDISKLASGVYTVAALFQDPSYSQQPTEWQKLLVDE